MLRANTVASVVLVVVACGDAPADSLRSEVTRVGDTTIVTTRGAPVAVRIDSVRLIWRSPELENPRALLAAGDLLVVADPTRLHILSADGERVRSVGRAGAGPGEFGSIAALGLLGPDTVAVHDVGNHRISFFSPAGEYIGAVRVTPAPPYVNPEGSLFVASHGGVVSFGERTFTLIVRRARHWSGATSRPTRRQCSRGGTVSGMRNTLADWSLQTACSGRA